MKKILIVDDEPIALKLLEQYLSLKGYDVTTALDGFIAIDKLEEHEFDLIISDVMMPNLSGLELLTISKEFHNKIPIIFVSVLDSWEIISKSLELGVDDFIVKPINFAELIMKIEKLLKPAVT